MRRALVLLFAVGISVGSTAIVFEEREFASPERAELYRELTSELRCLVCQNQSLADSDAPLAADLRSQVYSMLKEGAGVDEIHDYMVARYGDFVLYRPRLQPSTIVLWFGPFALAILGVSILFLQVRKRRVLAPALSDAERVRLNELLSDEPGNKT